MRDRTPDEIWRRLIEPEAAKIGRCLGAYYRWSVPPPKSTPAYLEFGFQRAAFEALQNYDLKPNHLFVAMRCAQSALASGTLPNEAEIAGSIVKFDAELEGAGARPVRDYRRQALVAAARELCERAFSDAKIADPGTVRQFTNRLADVFLQDALTRYSPAANTN
jgi:hypothetical protein